MRTRIGAGETPQTLSARLSVPVCALLRANRLYSTEWLMPGREIVVPDRDFCSTDAGSCPVRTCAATAERFFQSAKGLPEGRIAAWSHTHSGAALTEWAERRYVTMRPLESMGKLAARSGKSETELRRLNRFYGTGCAGMRFILPK